MTPESAMKDRFTLFLNSESAKLAIIAACIAIPVIGGMVLCQSLLMRMLREDAQAASSEWVSMLVARNPDILTLFTDATPSVQTKHLLDEATQLGDIYRFRIWDTSGNLVYNSERLKSVGAPIAYSGKRVASAVASGSVV